MDALGNLVKVTEPVVGDTNYTYDVLNHLTQVSMTRGATTQLRTFVYDATTQRLTSATNPETGTVSYAYNADGTLLSKTDAKNQRIQYGYDDKQRVTSINRYNGQTLNYCDAQTFTYDSGDAFSENTVGRLVKEEWTNPGCANDWTYIQTHSYTPAGLRTKKKLQAWRIRNDEMEWRTIGGEDANSFFSYDNEGRVAAGEGRTYVYDSMGRLSQLKENDGTVLASATYGAAGQMLTMGWTGVYETREYNSLLQLTRQRAVGMFNIVGLDVEYRYPAGTNNGRITSQKENVSGEEVSYQYDELNRLIAATTTGPQWGLSFGYDGFGNRTTQTVTKGTAYQVQLSYDGLTNRVNSAGWSHDANGNVTAMPLLSLDYDGYNRLSYSYHSSQGVAYYGYDPSNKRVWQTDVNGVDKFTYYNVLGQRTGNGNVYFAGRLIMTDGGPVVTDRLGSVRRRMNSDGYWGEQLNYFPYGEEQVATASDKEKFGTYLRDQKTNLDYADQRYFASGFGRFQTPDAAPADPANPQSWNRYSYVHGDPVNLNDPDGRLPANVSYDGGFGCVQTGYFAPGGTVDASNACPPGYAIAYSGYGSSKSKLQQIFELFDGTNDVISDWDYANPYGSASNLSFADAATWEIAAGVCVAQPQLCIAAGVGMTVYVTWRYAPVLIDLIRRAVAKQPGIGKPKDGLPRGSKPIDEWGLSHEEIEKIEKEIGAKPNDWVGMDPDGNIWTGSPSGEAVNHGPR